MPRGGNSPAFRAHDSLRRPGRGPPEVEASQGPRKEEVKCRASKLALVVLMAKADGPHLDELVYIDKYLKECLMPHDERELPK